MSAHRVMVDLNAKQVKELQRIRDETGNSLSTVLRNAAEIIIILHEKKRKGELKDEQLWPLI